jgi:hypothetical protein
LIAGKPGESGMVPEIAPNTMVSAPGCALASSMA